MVIVGGAVVAGCRGDKHECWSRCARAGRAGAVVLELVVLDQRLEKWNQTTSMGIDAANGTPWAEVRKWMTEEFCPRSVLQRLEQELYNLKLKGTDIDGYTILYL
ncbi:hypothetical protein Tco_0869754 [Tanacetum coccineum]